MVAPLPVGLPLTHLRQRGVRAAVRGHDSTGDLDGIVERCLRQAALWDEVKDRLG